MSAARITLDGRRRLHLPKDLTDAAGIGPGRLIVTSAAAGELILATPHAALARLRRRLTTALTLTGDVGSLTEVLHRRPGRAPHPGPETGERAAPVRLPDDGPVLVDTAVLTALLDHAPGSDLLVPLLPRMQVAEAAADELLHVVLDAGLPAAPGGAYDCDHTTITQVLAALGVTETARDATWAPVRIAEYELLTAGIPTLAERTTLAVAAHRRVPALLARTVPLPGTVTVTAYRWQDLAARPPASANPA